MNELVENELIECENLIVFGLNSARQAVFRVRDGELYKLGGYSSFEEWGEKRFGYSHTHLKRLVGAERVQLSLGAPIGAPVIPESQLRPLTSVPEEERAAIWAEANRIAEELGKERTAKMVQEAVDKYKLELDELNEQLELNEATFNDYKDSEKTRIKNAEAAAAEKWKQEAKDKERLFDESVAQTKRIVEEKDRVEKVMRASFKKELAAKELEIEQAKKDGEQSAIETKAAELAEIERRLELNTQKLEKTKAEADQLSASISLEKCSRRVTQSIYNSMISISAQFDEFALELSEEQRDVANDQMIATWEKIAKQFRSGCDEVDGIVRDLKDKSPAKLRVINGDLV